jgi:hypothetical protein
MLTINFKVDEQMLARLRIARSRMPVDFANYLFDKYKDSYRALQADMRSQNIDSQIIAEVQQQPFFEQTMQGAKENCERIMANWAKYEGQINQFLAKICKKEINLNATAYIVSPKLCMGRSIGQNSFVWGHFGGVKDKFYDLTYLVHESLHSYFNNNNLTHAIIENIADIELAKFLKHSQKGYSTTHSFLQDEHAQIYPYWNLYLARSRSEILDDQKVTGMVYDLDEFEKYRAELQKMNIDQLVILLDGKSKMQ